MVLILLNGNQIIIAQNGAVEAHADVSKFSKEHIFMHANTSTYLTGEKLLYKIYCLNNENNKPSLISKIAYVELIASNNIIVEKQKKYLENGMSDGDFFLPLTLKTGNYKLICYTKWMLNTQDFIQLDIRIINPYQPLPVEKDEEYSAIKNESEGSTAENFTSEESSNSYAITLNKESFNHREEVSLKIKSLTENDVNGNYSISIRKIDELPTNHQIHATEFSAYKNLKKAKQSEENPILLPELRGEVISGNLIAKKANTDLNRKIVALSIPGKSFAFKIVETDKLGKFNFILDQYPSLTQTFIQVMEENANDYSIQLDDIKETYLSDLKFRSNLGLNLNHKKAIEERSIANQIENAYYNHKKDSIQPEINSNSFFHSLEKTYVLDEFTRFPTLKETITEIILELYFIKKNKKYSMHLRNKTLDAEIYGAPLVLVDGLLIQDTNILFDFSTDNIYSISLINEPYVYGPKTFSGIINITTTTQNYETKLAGDNIEKFEILRPLSKKKYYSPDYSSGTTLNRIPDYRYQLLWLPNLNSNNKERDIYFYTSDVSGTFEIVMEGFTDSGSPISIRKLFEVN